MMSLPIKVTVNSVPKSYEPPTDMQGVLEAIPKFTDYELNDNGPPVEVNATGAGATLDGLWIWMLNQYKLPPRVMTGYRNSWWQVYTGKPNEIRIFIGYPNSYFDASGRGLQWSGWEGWALCNGQNGTPQLYNHFIIPGYRVDASGRWVANLPRVNPNYNFITGTPTTVPVDAYRDDDGVVMAIEKWNLPLLHLNLNGTDFFKWTKSGTGELMTVRDPGPSGSNFTNAEWVYPIDQWQEMLSPAQSSWVHILPPYIATGYVMFVGYQ
jgi:hypothetical protein